MTNKYNFLKSQTNPNMYKSYIHTTNFYRKKLLKKKVHTQTNYIYYIKMSKNNILKMVYNKQKKEDIFS